MLPHVTTNDQIFTTNNLQNVASSVGGASSTSALDDAITTQQLLPGRSCDPQVRVHYIKIKVKRSICGKLI